MKKEDFVKLGLSEELASAAEKASEEELKGYIPYTRFKEAVDEKNKLKTSLDERDKQLEDLKKSGGNMEDLKKQIETLQVDNKTKDEAHTAELRKLKASAAIEKALTAARAKNVTAVRALLPPELLDKGEIAEDGTLKGLAEAVEKLTKSEDTKFLFSENEKNDKKFKGTKPGESKDGAGEPGQKPKTLAEAVRLALESKE